MSGGPPPGALPPGGPPPGVLPPGGPPSGAPPAHIDPNFDIYASQRDKIIGSMVAITAITTISVGLRFLSRKLSKAGLWWDDYICLAALITSLAGPALLLYQLRDGLGRHIYIYGNEIEQLEKTEVMLKYLFAFTTLFSISTFISKSAVLAFYYRVFPDLRFRRLIRWVTGLCALVLIAGILTILLQCQPIHYSWTQVFPENKGKGHCAPFERTNIGLGSANVVLNLLISVLPIQVLRRLRTTFRQQVVLTALFSLAGFVVLASIIWVIYATRLDPFDFTWSYVDPGIWTALEPNLAVVCACLPSLRPLADIVGQRFLYLHPTFSPKSGKVSPSKRSFGIGGIRTSNNNFSKLSESDDMRPFAYGVSVYGGSRSQLRDGERGEMELEEIETPEKGIAVKTEITLVSSDRLYYNDKLF